MLLPANGGKWKAQQINCANNLKGVGGSFAAWSQGHDGKLPMQVSSQEGGTMDSIQSGKAVIHFLALTNSGQVFICQSVTAYSQDGKNYQKINTYTNYGIEPKLLVCASDRRCRWVDSKNLLSEFADTNISYFVGVDAILNNPKSILAGDRHLQVDGLPAKPGLLELKLTSSIGWSEEMHYKKSDSIAGGNILFADGHVEFLKSKKLNSVFKNLDSVTNHLAIP